MPSGAVDHKGDHPTDVFGTQRQHRHMINTQRHAGVVRQARLQYRQQVVTDGLLRKAACGTPATALLESRVLFAGIDQFVGTIRQLSIFVVNPKALSDPMISRTDLR